MAGTIVAAVAVVRAETWTLELKRLESEDSGPYSGQMDYIYRATYPQYFFMQMMPDGKSRVRMMGNEESTAAFKKIVKKEPKYHSPCPFRGVAKLGTQEFAFALDASAPKSDAKGEKPKKEKAKPQDGVGDRQAEREAHQGGGSPQGARLRPALLRLQSQRRPDRR